MVQQEESYAAVEHNTSGSRPKELFLVGGRVAVLVGGV